MPRKAIYRRLGYHRATTRLSPEQEGETERIIEDAQGLIGLQGVILRLPVRVEPPDRIILSERDELVSRNLVSFLRDTREVVLMGATAGSAVMDAIRKDTEEDRVTRAVILDAVASECVDAALDWIMSYVSQGLRREGKSLMNTRYSAGYGDLALENQRIFHRLLEMDRIGVGITESCILMPEKSVTAVTGVLS